MNNRKSWLFSFLLIGLFSFSAFANAPIGDYPTSINKQFQKLLKGIDMTDLSDSKTIYVDFLLNDKGEIMVLSTNDSQFDKAIKSKLNYKAIQSENLEYNTKYTIPLRFTR